LLVAARGELPIGWERAQTVAAGLGGQVSSAAAVLSRWSDPRERVLRRRHTARAVSVGLGGSTGVLGVATAGLAASDAYAWMVLGGGGLTALVAVPAVGALLRLRRLQRTPLPEPRPASVARPPRGSVAYEPLRGLTAGEQSLSELLGLLQRDPTVPTAEVDEARVAARAAASALRREAADLAALERARDTSPAAAAELGPVVDAGVIRLERGVHDFDGLVAAAARAVAAGSGPAAHEQSLTAAVDRIDALTAALTELAGLHAGRLADRE